MTQQQIASNRKIIHIDMDCFYAAVEMREHPELAHRPIAVGGLAAGRGVLSTCNYKAREFGLHSAMPTVQALKRCPDLVLLPGNFSLYKQVSEQMQSIFSHYADAVEPLSLDEAYLDVSDSDLYQGSATLIAEAIRQDIYQTTGLTASAGVAPLKFLAKIASDINKPNGLCVISPPEVEGFIESLALEKISGVGKVSIAKLQQHGYYTGADIRRSKLEQLKSTFGSMGALLWERCHGIDDRAVSAHRERKSVAVERTFAKDIKDEKSLQLRLLDLVPELKRRSAKHLGQRGMNKLGVKIKFSDFQQTTKEQQATEIDEDNLLQLLSDALPRGKGKAVRLLGVQIGLKEESLERPCQLNFEFSELH